jgi:hypothetical protein
MAEGVEIVQASTVQDAFAKARALYGRPAGMDLVLEHATPVQSQPASRSEGMAFTARAAKIIGDAAGHSQEDWGKSDHALLDLAREADDRVEELQGAFTRAFDRADKLEQDLAQATDQVEQATWKPIETAPRDETSILVTDARVLDLHQVVFWYHTNEKYPWQTEDGIGYHKDRFTHWMPLPARPPLSSTDQTSGDQS